MFLSLGIIILLIVSVLIFFGLAQRVLDRMKLNDKTAILFIGAMVIGSFLPNIPLFSGLSINIGGGIIPIVLAVYLIIGAENQEKTRAIMASIITGGFVYTASKLLGADPGTMFLDPIYMYALIAGLVAYLIGRSRRAAFIAGILGIVLSDIAYIVEITLTNTPGGTTIGGAGVFDTTILAGIIAVAIAEIIGETRERLQGGTKKVRLKSDEEKNQMASFLSEDYFDNEKDNNEKDSKESD
jgi:uncharacterized membrane protein